MAVDITASARMPGARKVTASFTPAGLGSTSTREKNTSKPTGMPSVSRIDSPRRSVMVTSALVWAFHALIHRPSLCRPRW